MFEQTNMHHPASPTISLTNSSSSSSSSLEKLPSLTNSDSSPSLSAFSSSAGDLTTSPVLAYSYSAMLNAHLPTAPYPYTPSASYSQPTTIHDLGYTPSMYPQPTQYPHGSTSNLAYGSYQHYPPVAIPSETVSPDSAGNFPALGLYMTTSSGQAQPVPLPYSYSFNPSPIPPAAPTTSTLRANPYFTPYPYQQLSTSTSGCIAPTALFGKPSGMDVDVEESYKESVPPTGHASPASSSKSFPLPQHEMDMDLDDADLTSQEDLSAPASTIKAEPGEMAGVARHSDAGLKRQVEALEARAKGAQQALLKAHHSKHSAATGSGGFEHKGRKRSRTAQACERCRIRKARCFGGNPCDRCIRRKFVCEFSTVPRARGPTKPKEHDDAHMPMTPKRQRRRTISADLCRAQAEEAEPHKSKIHAASSPLKAARKYKTAVPKSVGSAVGLGLGLQLNEDGQIGGAKGLGIAVHKGQRDAADGASGAGSGNGNGDYYGPTFIQTPAPADPQQPYVTGWSGDLQSTSTSGWQQQCQSSAAMAGLGFGYAAPQGLSGMGNGGFTAYPSPETPLRWQSGGVSV